MCKKMDKKTIDIATRILTLTLKNPRSTPLEIGYYLERKMPVSFKLFTRAWDYLIDNNYFSPEAVVSLRVTLDESIKRLKKETE